MTASPAIPSPELLENNAKFAETHRELSYEALVNMRPVAIVTCTDFRVDIQKAWGLQNDILMVRVGGGKAFDALRSLIIMQQQVGCREIHIVQHTDCSVEIISTAKFRKRVKAENPGNEEVARLADAVEFGEWRGLENSVKADIGFLKNHPLMAKDTKYTGWIYDLKTGKTRQIV